MEGKWEKGSWKEPWSGGGSRSHRSATVDDDFDHGCVVAVAVVASATVGGIGRRELLLLPVRPGGRERDR